MVTAAWRRPIRYGRRQSSTAHTYRGTN